MRRGRLGRADRATAGSALAILLASAAVVLAAPAPAAAESAQPYSCSYDATLHFNPAALFVPKLLNAGSIYSYPGDYSGSASGTCGPADPASATTGTPGPTTSTFQVNFSFSGSYSFPRQEGTCDEGIDLQGSVTTTPAGGSPAQFSNATSFHLDAETPTTTGSLTVDAQSHSNPVTVTWPTNACGEAVGGPGVNEPSVEVKGSFVSKDPLGRATSDQAAQELQSSHPSTTAGSVPLTIDDGGTDPDTDQETITLNPALNPSTFATSGTLVDSAIAPNSLGGFTIAGGGEPPIQVKPVARAATASAVDPNLPFDYDPKGQVVNGAAALYPNTAPATDTVRRPLTNGVAEYMQIRGKASPAQQTWTVLPTTNTDLTSAEDAASALAQGPVTLQQLDPQTVAVVQTSVTTPDPNIDSGIDSSTSAGQGAGGATGPSNDSATQYDTSEAVDEAAQQKTDGQTIAVIKAPSATDAAGKSVPVTLTATGHAVAMKVNVAAGAYSYPIVAASNTTTRPPSCSKQPGTYRNALNAFKLPWKPPIGWALPRCRKLENGSTDGKPSGALNNGQAGDDPTNGLSRTTTVNIADSYGDTIAKVKYDGTRAKPWVIYDATGKTEIDAASTLHVGGHGCMFSTNSSNWLIVAFTTSARALRAFVPRSAFGNPRALPGNPDRSSTGCGRHMGTGAKSTERLADPGLDAVNYTKSKLDSKGHLVAGSSYNSYNAKNLSPPGASDPTLVVPLTINTTATAGGGIDEAILPISGSAFAGKPTDSFRVYDRFGYSDPNVYPCGVPKQARWRYVQIIHGKKALRMFGFIPRRKAQKNRC